MANEMGGLGYPGPPTGRSRSWAAWLISASSVTGTAARVDGDGTGDRGVAVVRTSSIRGRHVSDMRSYKRGVTDSISVAPTQKDQIRQLSV